MDLRERTIAALRLLDVGDRFAHLPFPKAAVLIPLFVRGQELHTLMTLRSLTLRSNAGEVCFPGGKRDPTDRDDEETALREAEEEIGLSPDQVQLVCKLTPVVNKRGLMVTPVVGFINEGFCPSPNPAEVSAVFTLPLDVFTQEGNHAHVDGGTGPAERLHFFDHCDGASGRRFQIWGLTAMLAVLVAVCALQKNTAFETGFDLQNPLELFERNLLKKVSKL